MPYTADERLFLTADKSEVVPDGDPRAAFLLASPGDELTDADAKRYGLKASRTPANKAETVDENKDAEPAEEADGDESHVCDECGFEAKSAAGLVNHQRTHEED